MIGRTMARASQPRAPDAWASLFLCFSVHFQFHFHRQLYLSCVSAQQGLLLSLALHGKEKIAVFFVLESFGNMHPGVQEQPKIRACTWQAKGREDTLLGVAVLSFVPPIFMYNYFSFLWFVLYFPTREVSLQQATVTASHLQVKEASRRVGI